MGNTLKSSNIYLYILDGAMKQRVIMAQYNPQEISFQKNVSWSDGNKGAGIDCPSLMFTAGEAITMSLELIFDEYESGKDIRPVVHDVMRLCMVDEDLRRPPQIQLCWSDANILGIGRSFIGVLTSATAKYTMFTSEGVPCRCTISVSIKQADDVGYSVESSGSDGGDSKDNGVKNSNAGENGLTDPSVQSKENDKAQYAKPLSAAELSNTPGGTENAVNKGGDPTKPENYPAR